MQNRKAVTNQRVDLVVAAIDSGDLASIFGLFLTEVAHRFLEETGKFFMFPLAAMAGAIRSVLAWRQAKLEGGKNGTIQRAVVETVGAAAVTVAVIGGLAAASIFATISPIIFAVTLGAKALFHAGSSLYYLYKSFTTSDEAEKKKYRAAALGNFIGTIALVLATAAVTAVMILAKPALAVLGIMAGVIGTVYSLYKLATMPTPPKVSQTDYQPLTGGTELKTPRTVNVKPSNSVTLQQALSASGVTEVVTKPVPQQVEPGKSSTIGLFAVNPLTSGAAPAGQRLESAPALR